MQMISVSTVCVCVCVHTIHGLNTCMAMSCCCATSTTYTQVVKNTVGLIIHSALTH